MDVVRQVGEQYTKREIPDFRSGDTVRVEVRIKEGEKLRVQAFEGVVISIRGGGIGASFTVRKVSSGYGVERVFPLYSPVIESIKKIKRGKVRRAKLYYLRERKGKAARIKELR